MKTEPMKVEAYELHARSTDGQWVLVDTRPMNTVGFAELVVAGNSMAKDGVVVEVICKTTTIETDRRWSSQWKD